MFTHFDLCIFFRWVGEKPPKTRLVRLVLQQNHLSEDIPKELEGLNLGANPLSHDGFNGTSPVYLPTFKVDFYGKCR